jgi:hypothetical protein
MLKEHAKIRYRKKMQEVWGEEMAKALEASQNQDGNNTDINDIGGLIG